MSQETRWDCDEEDEDEITYAEFFIPGKPVGKMRTRACVRGGFAGVYTPKKETLYENNVRDSYIRKYEGRWLGDSALEVTLDVFFAVPKSCTKKRRKAIEEGKELPKCKPDIDNIVKSVLDGLNGVAYTDDKNIISVYALKHYAEDGREGVFVTLKACAGGGEEPE